VRRSLHFGAETPRQKTKTKSPAKKKPTFEFLDDDAAFQPLLQLTTPSKSGSFLIFDLSFIFKLLINYFFFFFQNHQRFYIGARDTVATSQWWKERQKNGWRSRCG